MGKRSAGITTYLPVGLLSTFYSFLHCLKFLFSKGHKEKARLNHERVCKCSVFTAYRHVLTFYSSWSFG